MASGCAGSDKSIPRPDTTFGPSSKVGVVVAGVAIARYGTTMLKRAAFADAHEFEVTWRRYDPGTEMLLGDDHKFVFSRSNCEYHCDKRVMAHVVRLVPPGDYILSGIMRRGMRRSSFYAFIGFGKQPGLFGQDTDFERSTGSVLNVRAPRLRVRSGEIIYIGDFIFNPFARTRQQTRIKFSRDDIAAQTALRRYSGIKGRMVFRLPR